MKQSFLFFTLMITANVLLAQNKNPVDHLGQALVNTITTTPKETLEPKEKPSILHDANSIEQAVKSNKPVIIDFSAIWCPPCQRLKPIFKQVAEDLGKRYQFAEVDVDRLKDLADHYQVQSLPTLLFIKEGQVKGRIEGGMSEDKLRSTIKKYLG